MGFLGQISVWYAVPYLEKDVLYIFSWDKNRIIHIGIPPEHLISIKTLSSGRIAVP
jgi:hypothetical protein